MTWEVFIVSLDGHFESRNDAAEDEHLLDLGSFTHVKEAVAAAFPGTTWTDAGWGTWTGGVGTVGFDIGDEEPVQTMDLHVDAGPGVIDSILALANANGWRAGDSGGGKFLDLLADPAAGLKALRGHS